MKALVEAAKSEWLVELENEKQRLLLEEKYKDCPHCRARRNSDMDDDLPF